MNNEALNEAVKAAKEFLKRAKTHDAEIERLAKAGHKYPTASKESGAVKRASMDLTRALVGVRRP